MAPGFSRITIVTAPAASRALTTVETVRDDLQIETIYDDRFIGRLIARASSAIGTYCRRTFALTGYQDTFRRRRTGDSYHGVPGTRDSREHPLVLGASPVAEISALTIDGVDLVAGVDYELEADAGLLYRLGTTGLRQAWRFETGTVAYTAGWVLPTDESVAGASGPVLPDDVEMAAIDLVKLAYAARKRDASIKVELLLEVRRVEYFDPSAVTSGQLPAGIDLRLEPYRLASEP